MTKEELAENYAISLDLEIPSNIGFIKTGYLAGYNQAEEIYSKQNIGLCNKISEYLKEIEEKDKRIKFLEDNEVLYKDLHSSLKEDLAKAKELLKVAQTVLNDNKCYYTVAEIEEFLK